MSVGIPSPGDGLTAALRAAPELAQSPGAALAVSQTPSPSANAQAAGYALQQQNLAGAQDQFTQTAGAPPAPPKKQGGFLGLVHRVAHDVANDVVAPVQRDVFDQRIPGIKGGPFKTVGGALGATPLGALNLANLPLKQVQHEYRYVRDVWQRHGPIPAVAEMLGMAGAGIVASRLTGSTNVGVLAGEAAGGLEGQLFYKDSWQRTANGNAYRDASGQLVSPGRDVARLLGVERTGAVHGIVSGGMDGLFDILLDPLQRAGGIYGEAKTPEGNKLFAGLSATRPGDAVSLYQRPGWDPSGALFRRAVGEMASTDSAAEIARRFPAVTNMPGMAQELANADTDARVLQVFEDHLGAESAAEGHYEWRQGVPVTSRVGQTADDIAQWAKEHSRLARSAQVVVRNEMIPMTDAGVAALRRQASMGLTPSQVELWANKWLEAGNDVDSEVLRRNILKSATKAAILNRAGVPAEELDAGIAQKINAALDTAFGGEGPVGTGAYGVAPGGEDISMLTHPTADGSGTVTVGAGGWEAQVGDPHLVPYSDFKDLSQQIAGYRAIHQWPGVVDDFAWDHFTGPWAKLALLTGAFAAHITLAENFLNAARLGLGDMVKGAIDGEIGRMGYRVAQDDAGPITAFVYHALGSPDAEQWAALQADPALADKISLRVHTALVTNGHMVDPSVSAGFVLPTSAEAPGETVRNAMDGIHLVTPKGLRVSDTYRMWGPQTENYDVWWGQHLNMIAKSPGGQQIAQAYLDAARQGLSEEEGMRNALEAAYASVDGMDPAAKARFLRAKYSPIEGVDPTTAFAQWRVQSLMGAVTGQDGTVNDQLIAKIANGDNITYQDLKGINRSQVPSQIPGRDWEKDPSGRVDRIAEIGHHKILSPIINKLSRTPTFMAGVEDAYAPYAKDVADGLLDRGTAMNLAMQDASSKMIRYVHNPAERLQMTETMRNVAPFWFAQVQAYKRYGRLLLEDPGAFRRAQLVLTGMTNLANTAKSANGVQQAVYPGSGWFTKGMLTGLATLGMPVTSAVPVSFAGSTSSLQAVDPFMEGTSSIRPNMGPLVAVAAHMIDDFDPRSINFVTDVVGPTTGAQASQERGALAFSLGLIPNTPIRDSVEGLVSSVPGLLRSNDSIWMQTLANLDYAQNVALAKWQQTDQFQSWVSNGGDPEDPNAPGRPNIVPSPEAPAAVRQAFVDTVKNQARFVRLVQAVMAEVSPASPQPIIGNQKIPKEFQDMVTKVGLDQAYVDFAAKYPTAAPLIQAMSSIVGGGTLAASKDAMAWVDKNIDFVNANKDIASFFVPQVSGEKYDPSTYNEQIAMGLRVRKTPQEFQNDFYTNTGWADYDANRAVYNQNLANGADPTTERAKWNAWLQTFERQNPTWAAVYESKDNQVNAQQQFAQVRQVLSSGNVPASPQVQVIQQLIDSYNNHVLRLVPSANGTINPSSSTNIEESKAWEQWLKDTAKNAPETAPFINKILRWLT